ncbi:hypothetical protein M413DRAFT_30579 [Hebeloma cylindrosporum]|uniref:Uncharacterized protein n=1 Tax=Hebeloma cylindrosporum TaxID=76867 RepID=A0A0C2XJD5_HEBCY|nr:hypothetical protein M413DRAFT_30579 [Hebeloma cylindrosporum h7]
MFLISPDIGTDGASGPKDADAGEEDNPAESDDDDGDLEDLFGDDEYKVERAFRDSGLEAESKLDGSFQESPMPKLDKGKGKAIEEPEYIEHITETIPPLLDKGKGKEIDVLDNRGLLLFSSTLPAVGLILPAIGPRHFSGTSSFPLQTSSSNFMDGSQPSGDPMSIDDTAAQASQAGSSFPLPAESHSYGLAPGQLVNPSSAFRYSPYSAFTPFAPTVHTGGRWTSRY